MQRLKHPARIIPIAFLAAIIAGTVLLMLPIAYRGPGAASPVTALFTSTSAVCVTGLTAVDTATYWTPFGKLVILGLVQIGGFGIMTLASALGILVAGRMRLRQRLVAQNETKSPALGNIRGLLLRTAIITAVTEVTIAILLYLRWRTGYGYDAGTALWHGIFHSVSAFNNAGFAMYSDNLEGFVGDPLICVPVALAVIVGGIGSPVVVELVRGGGIRRPRSWTLHTKLTVLGTVVLLAIGFTAYLSLEWGNGLTLGPLSVGQKINAAFFSGVMPRTAGFNSLAIGDLHPATLALTDILMFIGGGSAGTAGGVKITTVLILASVVWAEIRGEPDVSIFKRKLGFPVQRQALTIVLLGLAVVAITTGALLALTPFPLDVSVFEAVSAFGTVGLSTGITGDLPAGAQVALVAAMYIGRVGTISVATALALNYRHRRYRLPEQSPIIG